MSISNYAELKILDHLTGTTAWTGCVLTAWRLNRLGTSRSFRLRSVTSSATLFRPDRNN